MAYRPAAKWQGVPCDSDAWPFATDVAEFEARRAIGQLVRTALSFPKLADPAKVRALNPALTYASAAKQLREIIDDVVVDLVSEARVRGATWAEIGKALDVGSTAAQKRFGIGLTEERRTQLNYEALVVKHTSEITDSEPDDAFDEFLEELDGTTPADRVRYSFGVMRGLLEAFNEAQLELAKDDVDSARLWSLFYSIHERQMKLVETLLPDVEQWRAVAAWSGSPANIDSAHYHSPDAYIYLTMRQLWLGAIWTSYAVVNEDPDVPTAIEFFHRAKGLMEQMASILMRDDVREVLPRQERESED